MLKGSSNVKMQGILTQEESVYDSRTEVAVANDLSEVTYSDGKDYYEYLYSMKTNDVEDDSDYCAAFMMF